ncbi:Gfo/Idh/MocA family protein [Homoserinimonas sp. A447]
MSVRWGILGTGFIAELFAADLNHVGAELVAVGSRSDASARRFAERFGVPVAHDSYRALCEVPSIDAIYVASPNPFHAEHALMALRAGKHVLLEKPFTMTTDAARAVIDEAAARGRVVMEAMWTRFLPHMVRAREIVADGTIGEPRALEANLSQAFAPDPEHRLNNPELGGGALLDLGVYVVSLATDFLGLPRQWHAVVSPAPTGVDSQASIVLGFDGGAQAALHIGLDHRGSMRATLLGTLGRIEIDDAWHRASALSVFDNEGTLLERFEPVVESRGMQFEAAAFEALIADGVLDSPVMPQEQTLAVLEVVTDIRDRFMAEQPQERP